MNEYTTIIIIVSIVIFILLFVAAAKIDAADAVSLMESEAKPMAAEPEIEVIPIWDVPMPEEHQRIVHNYCKMFDMDERIVYGVIFAESTFDNDAINPETGCFGYMQLNPDVYDPERFKAPARNLYAGIAELTRLECIYHDMTMVLLCYNWGEAGARQLIDRGVTSTAYTKKVLTFAEQLTSTARLYDEVRING